MNESSWLIDMQTESIGNIYQDYKCIYICLSNPTNLSLRYTYPLDTLVLYGVVYAYHNTVYNSKKLETSIEMVRANI